MPSLSVSKPAGRDIIGVARSARHSVPSLPLLLKGSSAQATICPVPARVSLARRASMRAAAPPARARVRQHAIEATAADSVTP